MKKGALAVAFCLLGVGELRASSTFGFGVRRAGRSCYAILFKSFLREQGKSPVELEQEAFDREYTARRLTGHLARFTGQRLTAQDMRVRNMTASLRHMLVKSGADPGEVVASWSNHLVGTEVKYASLLRNEEDISAIEEFLRDGPKPLSFDKVMAFLESRGRFAPSMKAWAQKPLSRDMDAHLRKQLKGVARQIRTHNTFLEAELATGFEEYKVVMFNYEKVYNGTDEELRSIVQCVESGYRSPECFPKAKTASALSSLTKKSVNNDAFELTAQSESPPSVNLLTDPDIRREAFQKSIDELEAWGRDFKSKRAADFEELVRDKKFISMRGVPELLADWKKVKKQAFDDTLSARIKSFFDQRVDETKQGRDMWEAAHRARPELVTSDKLQDSYRHLFPTRRIDVVEGKPVPVKVPEGETPPSYVRHELDDMEQVLKGRPGFRVYLAEENARRETLRAMRFLGADVVRIFDRSPAWLRPLFASLVDFEKREVFGPALRKFERQAHLYPPQLTEFYKDLVDEMNDLNPHMRREDFIETTLRRPDSASALRTVEAYAQKSGNEDYVELAKEIQKAREEVRKRKLPPMTVEGDNMVLRRAFLVFSAAAVASGSIWYAAGGHEQLKKAFDQSGKQVQVGLKNTKQGAEKSLDWAATQWKKFQGKDKYLNADQLERVTRDLEVINDKLEMGEEPTEEVAKLKRTIESINPKSKMKFPASTPSSIPRAPGTVSAPKFPEAEPPVVDSPASSPAPAQSPVAPKSPGRAKAATEPRPSPKSESKKTPAP